MKCYLREGLVARAEHGRLVLEVGPLEPAEELHRVGVEARKLGCRSGVASLIPTPGNIYVNLGVFYPPFFDRYGQFFRVLVPVS